MAITQVYVDPAINAYSGTGTIGDPFGDLQYALNTKVRDAVNGDQFNIKAGTAEVLAASLSLAIYGTPTSTAMLVLRGYTAAANDGGVGEINCNGVRLWAVTTYGYIALIDLQIHSFGNNNGIDYSSSNSPNTILRCNIHKGASNPGWRALVNFRFGTIMSCYIHDAGAVGTGISCGGPTVQTIMGNYIAVEAQAIVGGMSRIVGNVLTASASGGTYGIYGLGAYSSVLGNCIYASAASTGNGIYAVNFAVSVMNNVVVGFSGVGGVGILLSGDGVQVGHNAFYNCAVDKSINGDAPFDLTANDVTLAASPFTNPATGDFSLTTAAKAALRGVGWPAAYLGAHANTDGHMTIGPIQYGEAEAGGGGSVSISPWRGGLLG